MAAVLQKSRKRGGASAHAVLCRSLCFYLRLLRPWRDSDRLPVMKLLKRPSRLLASAVMVIALLRGAAAQCTPVWAPFVGGAPAMGVASLTTMANGDLIIGGGFSSIGSVSANHVARWNGTTWSPLGAGTGVSGVQALARFPNGDLLAASGFGLAIWNGTAWSPMPYIPNFGSIYDIAIRPNGDVFAVGNFWWLNYVARWSGSAWVPVGSGIDNVVTVATVWNGDLIIGGGFSQAGGVTVNGVARWNGTAWSSLGSGVALGGTSAVTALATASNGDLLVGGSFTAAGGVPANNIARWNGTTWAPLGAGLTGGWVNCMVGLPSGGVIAGGDGITAAGGVPVNNIARWDGASWSALGSGIQGGAHPVVSDGLVLPSGDLIVGGNFSTAGGLAVSNLARVVTTCPAMATSFGSGCPSSAGSNTLVAATLPWVDATFRATATGLPTSALVLTLTSVASIPQGVAPLTLSFPQAGIGCDVLTAPDILGLLVTTTGTAQSQMFLPNVPPLVGVTFYHQMVPIELDAQGNWISVTATNALQLTAGVF